MLRLAPIWHDSAKAMTVAWQDDGSASRSEGSPIAGTGAHHIWGVAEAVYRGMDPRFVVILASAHNPAHGPEKAELLKYLRAASIIAGKPYAAAGLNEDGTDLANPCPLEGYLDHLSDHDYVAGEVSMAVMRNLLDKNLRNFDGSAPDFWAEDALLAGRGDLNLYQAYLAGGEAAIRALSRRE
jgi:hypothetical protein